MQQKQISYEYSKKLFEQTGNRVGDVQRQIRSFLGKHKLHGLICVGKGLYIYNPILKTNLITEESDLNPRNFSLKIQLQVLERSKKKNENCVVVISIKVRNMIIGFHIRMVENLF